MDADKPVALPWPDIGSKEGMARSVAGAAIALAIAMSLSPADAVGAADNVAGSALALAPSMSVGMNRTTAQVGDTITLTPQTPGVDAFGVHRCTMIVESPGPELLWMQVSSDDCAAWTFPFPPAAPGDYRVRGFLYYSADGATEPLAVSAGEQTLTVTPGGAAVPWTTNYPVRSWAAADLVSDPTPAFGVPQTIQAPAGADACRLGWFGGYEGAWSIQTEGCVPWTFSVAEPTPDVAVPMFGKRGDVHVLAWSGTSSWSIPDPNVLFVGARRGESYNDLIPEFSGSGGSYESNLPAIFAGDARGAVFYADDLTQRSFAPVVRGLSSGSCTDGFVGAVVPIVSGECAAYPVPLPGGYNQVVTPHLELRDQSGALVATTSTDLGFVVPLAPLEVDAPPSVPGGVDYTIAASDSAGVPASWSISLAPTSASATSHSASVVASSWQQSGTFNASMSSNGGSVQVAGPKLAAGTYAITARFIDVKGSIETTTRTVTIGVDSGKPVSTAPITSLSVAATIIPGTLPIRLSWTGSDAVSGIARYELQQSTDGGAFVSVSTSLTKSLLYRSVLPGHTYRFRVRAVDNAANIGAWAYGASFKLRAFQQSSSLIHYHGRWATSTSSGWWGGTAKSSSTKGSTASFTFTGKSIAWVGLKAATRGKAYVYVNGVLKSTVNLYSATTLRQRIVWSANYATSATRTITIKVVGTSGRPRVDIDGFIVGS